MTARREQTGGGGMVLALTAVGLVFDAAWRVAASAPGVWPTPVEQALAFGVAAGIPATAAGLAWAVARGEAATALAAACLVEHVAPSVAGALPLGTWGVVAATLAAVCAAAWLGSRGPRWAAGPLLGLALATNPWPARPGPAPDRPTVVLLTLDTARADLFDLCGETSAPPRSPTLAALAARGRVFCRAYAPAALTGPSHASMLSGLLPTGHGVQSNGQALAVEDSVPRRLRAAGWTTIGVVSAAVLDASLGFDDGFVRFDGAIDDRLARAWPSLFPTGFHTRAGSPHHRPGEATIALLEGRVPARGAFVWVHLYDLHWPYEASPEAAAAEGVTDRSPLAERLRGPLPRPEQAPDAATLDRGKRLYRAQAHDLDALLARLLEMLPADASIVVVGDHGESLDEHAYWFSHGRLTHGADTWVPMVVVGPGVPAGRVEVARSTVDVAGTLLALAGLDPFVGEARSLLEDASPDVWSFAWRASFLGARAAADPALGPLASVSLRRGAASAVWWDDGRGLFDTRVDPTEVGDGGPVPEEWARALGARIEAVEGPREVAPGQEEMLRGLGYVE